MRLIDWCSVGNREKDPATIIPFYSSPHRLRGRSDEDSCPLHKPENPESICPSESVPRACPGDLK